MGEKKFSTMLVHNLSIDNLYGLVKTTLEITDLHRSVIPPLAVAFFDKPGAGCNELDKRMKKMLKSFLTPELDELHKHRKILFSEVKRFVTNAYESSSPSLKTAGEHFQELLLPYWNTNEQPLNTVTSLFKEMFDRYRATAALKTDATTIGCAALMTNLETVNSQYDAKYKARNAEVSAETGNSASEIKEDIAKSYENFCMTIEQTVGLFPSSETEQLFNEIDGLRKKYSALNRSKNEEKE